MSEEHDGGRPDRTIRPPRSHFAIVAGSPFAILALTMIAWTAPPALVTVGAVVVLGAVLAYGLWLIVSDSDDRRARMELGASLISAVLVAHAVLLLDVQGQRRADEAAARSDEATVQADLRIALTTTDDLRGVDLRHAELQEFLLRRKNLAEAALNGAQLEGADLTGSIVVGADLTQSTMTDATLKFVVWSDTTVWPTQVAPLVAERSIFFDPGSDSHKAAAEYYGDWIDELRRLHDSGVTLRVIDLGDLIQTNPWYPSRRTYEYSEKAGGAEDGIETPTFNSLRNVPRVGNEMHFLHVKVLGAEGGYSQFVTAVPGSRLLVRVYIHNNANTGESAVETKVRAAVPGGSSRTLRLRAYVEASNAEPRLVEAVADVVSARPIRLVAVPGSASALGTANYALPDSLWANGTAVGSDGPNGTLGPGLGSIVLVTFQVEVEAGD